MIKKGFSHCSHNPSNFDPWIYSGANTHRALGRSDIATTAYVPYLPCRHAGSCSASAGRMRGSFMFEGANSAGHSKVNRET